MPKNLIKVFCDVYGTNQFKLSIIIKFIFKGTADLQFSKTEKKIPFCLFMYLNLNYIIKKTRQAIARIPSEVKKILIYR